MAKINLNESIKKLSAIVDWFEGQKEVDVEAGLGKVKEAAVLIKESKARLADLENEFEEVKKSLN
jgi:hypothetical protein